MIRLVIIDDEQLIRRGLQKIIEMSGGKSHIFRVCNRTNFAPGKDVVKVEEKLLKVVPKEFKVDVHHWLILHGRYTCTARKPRCGACIIEDLCEYKEKTEY